MKIYSIEHTIFAAECDVTRFWKMPSIFVAMQEVADGHAQILKCARDDMRPKNMIWMIARIHVKMQRYPKHHDTIQISTWADKPTRVGFPRYFTFEDQKGVLGQASSLWMVVDTETLRLLPPQKTGLVFPDTSDFTAPMEVPKRFRLDLEQAKSVERHAVYNDIDMNNHVNNARYIEWVTDLFPPERYQKEKLKEIQINYISQIEYGQKALLSIKEENGTFIAAGQSEDKEVLFFEATGTFQKREEAIEVLP